MKDKKTVVSRKTERRLAILWGLLNMSTEIDAKTDEVIIIMRSIERKIGKETCLQYWRKCINSIPSIDERLAKEFSV